MKATIYVKKAGGKEVLAHCEFDDETWQRLKSDWTAWLAHGSPSGGAYPYTSETEDGEEQRELLLIFNQVAAVT